MFPVYLVWLQQTISIHQSNQNMINVAIILKIIFLILFMIRLVCIPKTNVDLKKEKKKLVCFNQAEGKKSN